MFPEGIEAHMQKIQINKKKKQSKCTIGWLMHRPLKFEGNFKTLEERVSKFSKITKIWHHRDFFFLTRLLYQMY